MGNPLRLRLAVGLFVLALPARGAIFCPDDRSLMSVQYTLPWSAIGYLNNGCTATLIDSQHILAAAHCFVQPVTGAWQKGPLDTGLRFYPNYHPDRPSPPFRTIDRVVVGSRTQAPNFPPPAFPAMDWGIAHLDSPVTDFPAMSILPAPFVPLAVMNAGYQRDPVIFGSGEEHFNPPPRPPEPDIDPNDPDEPTCNNCWWQPALVDPDCELTSIVDHIGYSSCSVQGGSSGSPIFRSVVTDSGTFFFIAASIFGGAAPDFTVSPCNPFSCCEPFTPDRASSGPVAESFRWAPRRSLGVGLATQEQAPASSGKPFTQVFSTDNDGDRVVVRRRAGVSLSDPFLEFAPDGSIPGPSRIAAFNEPGGRYRLVVITSTGELYTRGEGGSWSNALTPPSELGVPLDVDAVFNGGRTDRIFVSTFDGQVLTRRFLQQRTGWISVLSAFSGTSYRALAAVEQANGLTRLFLVDEFGDVFTAAEVNAKGGGTVWQATQSFGGLIPPLREIDAAWIPGTKRLVVYAVDESGELWVREAKAPSVSSGWNDWSKLETFLDAPRVGLSPPPEDILTLTATQWSEKTSGGSTRSVLFATDSYGNVYYLSEELRCTEPENCRLVRLWRSFYHF
jgi:hypothetical protein